MLLCVICLCYESSQASCFGGEGWLVPVCPYFLHTSRHSWNTVWVPLAIRVVTGDIMAATEPGVMTVSFLVPSLVFPPKVSGCLLFSCAAFPLYF